MLTVSLQGVLIPSSENRQGLSRHLSHWLRKGGGERSGWGRICHRCLGCLLCRLPAQPSLYPAAHGGKRAPVTGFVLGHRSTPAADVHFSEIKHGEVPNPHHHAGERPPAHDQPLLSGCKGSGAEFGASNAGKGPWCAAPLPSPHGAAGPAAGITFAHDFTVLCSAHNRFR